MSTLKTINIVHPSGTPTNLVLGNDGSLTVANNLTVTANTTISGKIVVTGNATFSNTVTVTGNAVFSNTIAVTGNATFSNTVTVTGNATFSNTVTLAASGITFSDATVQTTASQLVSGTAVSASGTSFNFTSIPSWVKRITLIFNGVSTNGTNPIQIQIGTGGSSTITGYIGSNSVVGTGVNTFSFTTGFGISVSSSYITAGSTICGNIFISRLGSNIWICSGVTGSPSGYIYNYLTSGSVTLAGVLDNLRIIASATGSPSDTFDAGSVNIMYE
jgi:hypothetical protein